MGKRPDTMRRIKIPVTMYGMLRPPFGFGECLCTELATYVTVVVAIIEFYSSQIVLVTALQMDQLPEQPLLDHIQHRHHVAAIAHILQHHHMGVVFLSRLDHIPMILQGDAEDHFGGYIFQPRLDSADDDLLMPLPGGRDDHSVERLFLQEVLPRKRASGIDLGHFLSALGNDLLYTGHEIVI